MSKTPNAKLLRQARRARKLSVSEVSSYAKISEARLAKFEAGDLAPSIRQMAKLSELYNSSLFSFYGEEDLDLRAVLPDFRKANPRAADISPKGLVRLWQIESRTKFSEELVEALGRSAPKTLLLSRFTNKKLPEAVELRAGFDTWLDRRKKELKFSGTPESIFTKQLRIFLEIHACSTAFNTAPVDDYIGFFDKVDGRKNTIFVNSEVKLEKRRLFTLTHEMAHLVFDREGLSDPFTPTNAVERECNSYAAQFLAPDNMMFSIVGSLRGAILNDVSRLVSHIAKETLLSRQATALRLAELDIISKASASEFFAYLKNLKRVTEPSKDAQGGTPMGRSIAVGRKLSEVGVYSAYVAFLALQHRIVDVVDIERGLGISESIQKDVLDLGARRFEAGAE